MIRESRSKSRRAALARRFVALEAMEGRCLLTDGFVGPLPLQPAAYTDPADPSPAPAPDPAPGAQAQAPAPAQPTFKTPEEAAADWGKKYNGPSITEGQEYGSTIYKNPDGTYSYTPPAKGGNASVTPSKPTGGETVVGDIHSHGKYETGYDNNNFSSADKADNDAKKIPGFLTSPDGRLQKYDPATKKVTVTATDLPSDPNDPNRQNTTSP